MTELGTGTGSATFSQTLRELAAAQKTAARGAPAYSRFVNRKIGRVLAAWAVQRRLGPNQVTAISALFTFVSIALLVVFEPSWLLGIAVGLGLVLGYAFDSADGQVARHTGTGSPAGEWLDHMVDATKVSALPIALAVSWFRFDVVPTVWVLVPLVNAIVGAVLFFGMILTEQLRRAQGTQSVAAAGAAGSVRALLVLPTDYGVLCLSFFLLGATSVFVGVYTFIVVATTGFTLLAAIKWFREIRAF